MTFPFLNITAGNHDSQDWQHYRHSVPAGTGPRGGSDSGSVPFRFQTTASLIWDLIMPTNCVTQQGKYGNRRVVSTTIQLLARPGSWPVVTHNKSQPVDCEYSTTTDKCHKQATFTNLGNLQHVRHTWTSTTSVCVFLRCWNPTEQPQWLLFSTMLTCTFHNPCSCFIYGRILWKNVV